ncbi:MAG: radical SAM protein [bacterium]|nr:radical SAM protein [bacterium]
MKIALIQTPAWGRQSPPFAIACLSAYLKSYGYEVYKRDINIELYDEFKDTKYADTWTLNEGFWGDIQLVSDFVKTHKKLIDRYVDEILESGSKIIGFTILWSTEQMSLTLASEIKKKDPSRIIVFGGPQASRGVRGEEFVLRHEVDFVVHGEGEETLYELVKAIEKGKAFEPIKGVLFAKNGKVYYGGDRPLIADLNSLPYADFSDFLFELYKEPVMLPATTSRGCPNNCVYCDEKVFWYKFRSRTGEKIFEEVKYQISKYNIKKIEFTDSLVNGNVKALEKFCDLVIENNLGIEWMGQATVRPEMTFELLQKIHNSGCFHLCFGMEHSSKKQLLKMGKILCKNADFDKFIKDCYKAQLAIGLNWMFGFPGDTEEDFQADLDFFTRNADYLRPCCSVNPSLGFCGFTTGCYAYSHPEEFNIEVSDNAVYWKTKDGNNNYVIRLNRFQKFTSHLESLGIVLGFKQLPNENKLIGDYYFCEKEYQEAAKFYEKSLIKETFNTEMFNKLSAIYAELNKKNKIIDKYIKLEKSCKIKDNNQKIEVRNIMKKHFPSLSDESLKNKIMDADVVLVQAPAWGISTPPLALASLTAYMRHKDYKVLALDLNIELYKSRTGKYRDVWELEKSLSFWNNPSIVNEFAEYHKKYLDDQIDIILGSGAKVVGFSIYFSSLYISLYLAKQIKKKNNKIIIVFGGPHVSRDLAGKTIVKDENVDFIVQGEGEVTLEEIVKNPKVDFCEGTLICKNGEVVDCGDRELIKDINSLPMPDFSDYDFNDYKEPFKIPIISSRGCCNKCIYCNERPFWKRFRFRTAENMYKEMLYQLEKHPKGSFFDFQDSLVNGSVKELEKLADFIIKDGLKIQWSGQAIMRKDMTYELLLKLKQSGCVALGYGMETASVPLMLKAGKLLAKDISPEKIVRDGYKAGVSCAVNFMFGLPGETEEDFRETLKFLRRNKDYIGTINPCPAFCSFAPGTYAYDHQGEFDIDFSKGGEYWESKDGSNTYLIRLRRFEELCQLAWDLKIPSVYPAPKLLNRNELIGNYYFNTGKPEKAIPYFINSIEKESRNISIIQNLASCYQKIGLQDLYEECLKEIKEWGTGKDTKTNEKVPAVTGIDKEINEAENFINSGDYENAILKLENILSAHPESTKVYSILCKLYFNTGKLDFPKELLQKTLSIDPDLKKWVVELGKRWVSEKKLQEACLLFVKLLSCVPDDYEIWDITGVSMVSVGKFQDGESCFKKSISIKPDYIDAYVNMGYLCKMQGKIDEAIAYLRKAQNIDPSLINLYYEIEDLHKEHNIKGYPFKYLLESINNTIQKGIPKIDNTINLGKGPEELHMELTYRCNCKCTFCDLWDKYSKFPELEKKQLTLEEIQKFIGDSKYLKNVKSIVLSGGEPFLRKDFVEICGCLTKHLPEASIGILTNSMDANLTMKKLVEVKGKYDPKSIWLGSSLDGLFEKHNEIRGRKDAFNNLVRTITNVQKEFEDIHYNINFTVTPENYTELLPVYEFVNKLNCIFSAQFVLPPDPKWSKEKLLEVQGIIEIILKKMIDAKRTTSITSDIGLLAQLYFWSNLVEYQLHPTRVFKKCMAGVHFAMFNPQGDLFFCPINKQMLVGNVKDTPFDKLWESSKATKIRDFMNSGKCHCWLLCTIMPQIGEAFLKGRGNEN